MKQRIPALLLAVILLLALPATATAAGTELLIRGPAAAPAAGERFSVVLELRGSPDVCLFQTTLLYDDTKLECTEVIPGPAVEGMLSAENPAGEDPAGATVAAVSVRPEKREGVLAEFHFRVLENGATVPRILYETLLGDENGTPLPFKVVQTLPDGAALAPADGGKGLPFTDTAGHPEEAMILRAAATGLFDGFPDGTFRPDAGVTRAQFVTVLWRMAGKPAAAKPAPFEDAAPDAWFADAVAWACETGAVNGRSERVFDPDGAVTRQEAMKVVFLYAGGVSGMEAMLSTLYDSGFTDSGEIADWAKPAMYWGYFNGLIGSEGDTALRPTDAATRAELARMLVLCADKTA